MENQVLLLKRDKAVPEDGQVPRCSTAVEAEAGSWRQGMFDRCSDVFGILLGAAPVPEAVSLQPAPSRQGADLFFSKTLLQLGFL